MVIRELKRQWPNTEILFMLLRDTVPDHGSMVPVYQLMNDLRKAAERHLCKSLPTGFR